jgi:hypothetical protein
MGGLMLSKSIYLTRLLSVDDVLFFCHCSRRDVFQVKGDFATVQRSSSMEINVQKSSIVFNEVKEEQVRNILLVFPYQKVDLQSSFKYLGFSLKPNNYRMRDWQWFIDKIENKTKLWCNRQLTLGGRLTLVKSVLEELLVN